MTLSAPAMNEALPDLFERLRTAPAAALLLDYDGTLAPFQLDPAAAVPYPGVREALTRIITQNRTRLAIVTGRWTRQLLPLLALHPRPEIWGSHGWERLAPDGKYEIGRIGEKALGNLVTADDWTRDIEALGGRCELKPAGLAIHWRGLPDDRVDAIRGLVFENWRLQRLDQGLAWHDFDEGIELRAPGRTKGDVIDTVLGELPAGAAVAYLGDDQTDEDAFRALGNRGLAVLVRPEARTTAAQLWLRPPEELLDFLNRWHQALR
jgi:trehalose 6-phosphate phosphatase